MRHAEDWLNRETGGTEGLDVFHFDYCAFPLETALDFIAEELKSLFFISNND